MPFMPPPAQGAPPPGAGMPPGAGAPPVEGGMPVDQGAPPVEEPPPGPGPGTSEGSLDEGQLKQFVSRGFQVIYGGKTQDGDLSQEVATLMRKGGNNPVAALAATAAQVAATVVTSAQDANVSLDPSVAIAGLMEIVGELGSVAAAEGIYDYSQREIDAAATQSGEKMYALTKDTGIFPQEEAMADAEGIMQASESGEMDTAISQIEHMERAGGGAPPAAAPPIMGGQGGQQ